MNSKTLFINGAWVEASGSELLSTDPSSSELVWQGSSAAQKDVAEAVNAARTAFPAWSQRPVEERIAYLEAYRDVLDRRRDGLAELIARESGKALWDAKTEIGAMIGKLAISIKAYHERTPTRIDESNGQRTALRHKPHGVLAVFGPFNFPGHLPNGHIVPALLAGNAIVFKPSEHTPAMGAAMIECFEEANLPEGVVNLVQGARETGQALASHPQIDGVLFTGSAEVGLALHRQFSAQIEKIIALELGGNNPLIAWDVDDLDAACLTILQSAYVSAGQRCTCARRLIVESGSKGDALLSRLSEAVGNLSVNAWNADPQPFYSCLINAAAAENVLQAQEDLAEEGGVILNAARSLDEGGALITPSLIDVTGVSQRHDEEIFGPLLQVIRVDTFEEAVEEANNTRFGLAAGLLSDSEDHYDHFIREIRAGIVNWNKPLTGASSAAPFGGTGLSGNHFPSAYYAADYCAYPVASMEALDLTLPDELPPGISL